MELGSSSFVSFIPCNHFYLLATIDVSICFFKNPFQEALLFLLAKTRLTRREEKHATTFPINNSNGSQKASCINTERSDSYLKLLKMMKVLFYSSSPSQSPCSLKTHTNFCTAKSLSPLPCHVPQCSNQDNIHDRISDGQNLILGKKEMNFILKSLFLLLF